MKQNSHTNPKKCDFLPKKISGKCYSTYVLRRFVCEIYATAQWGKILLNALLGVRKAQGGYRS
jgi:hypothetical protein